jgi:CTP synthase
MSKYIFITGGVVSSLGKGIASASLAALLQLRGYKVIMRKFDPYLNIDPGTMNPLQHGEVFVTDDGAETDLDLGHYERFANLKTTKLDSVTTGKIYQELITRERRGDYAGQTVQVIPHVTNLIKEFITRDTKDADFVLCEIGGTVGDIEAQPYCESIKQMAYELPKNQVVFIHLTLIPYIKAAKEIKTKPTQHSVKELMSMGIIPNILLCRTEKEIPAPERIKIASFCNVRPENVIQAMDVKSIYEVPIAYHEAGLDSRVLAEFGIEEGGKPDLTNWKSIVDIVLDKSRKTITIGVVGKYTKLIDAYKSIDESINHAAISEGVNVKIDWINSSTLKENNLEEKLSHLDGIIIPGGFGADAVQGKILGINYARTKNVPMLGICYGMQLSIIEFAGNVCGIKNAGSTEIDPNCEPLIGLMTEWDKDGNIEKRDSSSNLGGTMRLGAFPCKLAVRSLAHKLYGTKEISERHRHRYEVNIKYKDVLEQHGMVISGLSPDGRLPEMIEIPAHRFFIASQFHPEFKSRIFEPHPLFMGLVRACLKINN